MNGEVVEYNSEVELGERYEDTVTEFYGTATCVAFHLDGTRRVLLERSVNGQPTEFWADETRLQPAVAPRGDELSTVVE